MRQRGGTEALARVRAMRRVPTGAEAKLWKALRNRQLAGAKFRRQVWIDHYIVDFFCAEAGLVVELDGGQHADQVAHDEARTAHLASRGLVVVRFWNTDVEQGLEAVLNAIASHLPSPSHSAAPSGPLPLPRTGEGC